MLPHNHFYNGSDDAAEYCTSNSTANCCCDFNAE